MPVAVRVTCDRDGCERHLDVDLAVEDLDEAFGTNQSRHDDSRAALYIEGEVGLPEGWVASGGEPYAMRPGASLTVLCSDHGERCPACGGTGQTTRPADHSNAVARGLREGAPIPADCRRCDRTGVVER